MNYMIYGKKLKS